MYVYVGRENERASDSNRVGRLKIKTAGKTYVQAHTSAFSVGRFAATVLFYFQ